jgi:ATP-dependent HslUV protease subunit HslV
MDAAPAEANQSRVARSRIKMSIVVAVRKGNETILAADTQSNFGSLKVPLANHRAAKICRVGGAYLATTGWGLYENILDDFLARRRSVSLKDKKSIFSFFLLLWKDLHERYSLVRDQAEDEDHSPFGDLDARFLIINSGGIYCVSSDMSITEFNHYFAIGSGGDFAKGAVHALYDSGLTAAELASRAVETAIAFSSDCGGEIEVVRIPNRRAKNAG